MHDPATIPRDQCSRAVAGCRKFRSLSCARQKRAGVGGGGGKALEAPYGADALFDAAMVLLEVIVKALTRAVRHVLTGLTGNCTGVCPMAIAGDPIRHPAGHGSGRADGRRPSWPVPSHRSCPPGPHGRRSTVVPAGADLPGMGRPDRRAGPNGFSPGPCSDGQGFVTRGLRGPGSRARPWLSRRLSAPRRSSSSLVAAISICCMRFQPSSGCRSRWRRKSSSEAPRHRRQATNRRRSPTSLPGDGLSQCSRVQLSVSDHPKAVAVGVHSCGTVMGHHSQLT